MGSSANRWTPAEYEIVASCSISEAVKRLPLRTLEAIRTVRKKLRVGTARRLWTKAENRRLLKHHQERLPKLARRFKRRTVWAVKHQRHILIGYLDPVTPWKTTELAKLESLC
jgi:hypothetical protein